MKATATILLAILALTTVALAAEPGALVEMLGSDQQEVREQAVSAAGELGAAAIEPLFDALSRPEDGSTVLARRAVQAAVTRARGAERAAVANACCTRCDPTARR